MGCVLWEHGVTTMHLIELNLELPQLLWMLLVLNRLRIRCAASRMDWKRWASIRRSRLW